MEAFSHISDLMPGSSVYQIVEGQYFIPQQNLNETYEEIVVTRNLTQVFPNPNPVDTVSSIVSVVPVTSQLQVTTAGNAQTANGYMIDNTYYIQRPAACAQQCAERDGYLDDVQNVQIIAQNPAAPNPKQLNINSNEDSAQNSRANYIRERTKPPENVMKKVMAEVPEPIRVKFDTNVRERVAGLKIQVSGSFMSWNVAGRTILDLNFMRNLFYITKIDITFEPKFSDEAAVNQSLKKLVDNGLFSDWLALKCEERQMPFFKVGNQVEIYSINSFTALLSLISQESCLPLPFITKHERDMKYFYLNFVKTCNNRVKKLNMPVFHDADNGRKKIPCKYPGIRLDCSFEIAIKRFVIHVQKSAVAAFREYVTYLRQVLIYNHIVWGFLQAWTRKVREHYNGCFREHEIAQNLSLCQGDIPLTEKTASNEMDLIYNINYLNFYLKFDPVTLRDTTVSFTIENFETKFVCDVAIVQYYRQFFLINDMHYSDALTNIVLFSKENGASNVTEFVYMAPKDTVDRSSVGYSLPGGISRSSPQQQIPQASKEPNLSAVVQVADRGETPVSNVSRNNVVQVTQRNLPPVKSSLTKPLIKTRTVEEINFAVDMKKSMDESQLSFDSIMPGRLTAKAVKQPAIPTCLTEALNHCYVKNRVEICKQDISKEPKVLQRIFNEALQKAMEMRTIESFIEKLYVSLQKFFTNLTCQLIMSRTIKRALETRFPNLKSRFSCQNPVQGESQLSAAASKSRTVQDNQNITRPPNRVSETAVKETAEVVSSSEKTQPIPKPENVQPQRAQPVVSKTDPPNPPTAKPPENVQPQRAQPVVSKTDPPNPPTAKPPENVQPQGAQPVVSKTDPPNPPTAKPPENGTLNIRNRNLSKTPNTVTPVKPRFIENSIPNKTNMIPNEKPEELTCTINNDIDRGQSEKQPQKVTVNEGSAKKTVNGAEVVTAARMEVVEAESNISIELTQPLSKNVENKIIRKSIPEKTQNNARTPDGGEQENEGVLQTVQSEPKRTKEINFPPQKKGTIASYNLVPCSVVLNPNDVANYVKGQEEQRKRRRDAVHASSTFRKDSVEDFSDSSSILRSDDSRDSDFLPKPPKKRKNITSELQLLEARTRVLQRLRKRDNTCKVYDRNSYSSDDVDNFLIQTPQSWPSRRSSNSGKRKSDAEDPQYRALYNECLTRKAVVLMTKLEDTTEYQKKKSKWRVVAKPDGRLTLTRENGVECNILPKNKRKYFEVKEGKLYLKKQYQVKNGRIMLVNSEKEQENINLKDEPPFAENELDCASSCIKQEESLD